MKVAIRGYCDKKQIFEELADLDDDDSAIEKLATTHAKRLYHCKRQTIEIEFLDEPDPNKRFFRFGTDPSTMKQPIEIKRTDLTEGALYTYFAIPDPLPPEPVQAVTQQQSRTQSKEQNRRKRKHNQLSPDVPPQSHT